MLNFHVFRGIFNHMSKSFIPCFFLFVISIAYSFGSPLTVQQYAGTTSSVDLIKKQDLPMKGQISAYGMYGLLINGETNGLSIGAGVQYTFPTSLRGGFSYKGYKGFLTYAYYQRVLFHNTEGPLEIRGGFTGGGKAHIVRFHSSDHYFFYPSITGSIFSDIMFKRPESLSVRIGIPLTYHFRREVTAYSVGVEITLLHNPFHKFASNRKNE
jgi:hypothetical protein